jgi:hypothetical protein
MNVLSVSGAVSHVAWHTRFSFFGAVAALIIEYQHPCLAPHETGQAGDSAR